MELIALDACKYLNVPMTTLTRWITEHGLPARVVDGSYRISRTELLEWAILNQVEAYPELLDHYDSV